MGRGRGGGWEPILIASPSIHPLSCRPLGLIPSLPLALSLSCPCSLLPSLPPALALSWSHSKMINVNNEM